MLQFVIYEGEIYNLGNMLLVQKLCKPQKLCIYDDACKYLQKLCMFNRIIFMFSYLYVKIKYIDSPGR